MTDVSSAVDAIDLRIIDILRGEARISWRELGERVHLSPTSSADRVRRLEQLGVIEGYSARIDPVAVGRALRAVVAVNLPATMDPADFEARLAERPEIAFAAFIAGAADYSIVVDCDGPSGLDEFIRWLKHAGGAARTESNVVLRRVVA